MSKGRKVSGHPTGKPPQPTLEEWGLMYGLRVGEILPLDEALRYVALLDRTHGPPPYPAELEALQEKIEADPIARAQFKILREMTEGQGG